MKLITDSGVGAVVPPVTFTLKVSCAEAVASATLVAVTVTVETPENWLGVRTRLVPSMAAVTTLGALLCTV